MNFFGGTKDSQKSDSFSKSPNNINCKDVSKQLNIKGESLNIVVKDALFGVVNGKEIMLDEIIVNNMILDVAKAIGSNMSKYNIPPKTIILSKECSSMNKDITKEENMQEQKFINLYSPKYEFKDVYIDESSKKQIMASLAIAKYKDKLFSEWGLKNSFKNHRAIVFNFFGPPGTGKSMMAEAIASYLNKKIINVNYAELESKYVGETPKNIRSMFEAARKKDAVLVFDEADSFLGKRLINVSQSADCGVNITRSVMLMELEKFEGVVIFTTNLLSNYDDAFKRRILASIEFKLPNKEGRRAIWSTHIPDKLPLSPKITLDLLSEKYINISGADIKDILLYASVLCLQRNDDALKLEDFEDSYKYIMSRYEGNSNIHVTHERITEEQYKREMESLDKR